MSAYKSLDMDRVRAALQDAAVGHTIDYHGSIETTQPIAMDLAHNPATTSGTVVFAEEQVAGRGRRGRSWSAPFASSLLFSVIFVGRTAERVGPLLAMIAGVAVADAISTACPSLQSRVRLKWPNDVIVLDDPAYSTGDEEASETGYGYQKVGGILAQVEYRGDKPQIAVVGMGLNVNQDAADLPEVVAPMVTPGSLRQLTKGPVDREDLFIRVCRALDARTRANFSDAEILDEYRSRLTTLGEQVYVYASPGDSEPLLHGTAEDVSAKGDLLVRDADGTLHTVSAGDVSVRPAA